MAQKPKDTVYFYGIPAYGHTLSNLYLAGRNISGTHMAHSNYRVMPICANMGQAVGVAAAICVKEGTVPRELSAATVQRRLIESGVQV